MQTKFRTLNLAINFYLKAKNQQLPSKHLKVQFDRALLSIVLNLAEGSAKPTERDRLKFYSIALGSLRETQMILHLTEKKQLLSDSDSLAASLYCLCQSLKPSLTK